jgi:4-hydroxy-tetrahydrodipicolinate reductase
MLNIAIIGATGRMGQCIIRAALDEPDLKLRGGLVSPASDAAGTDLGELAGRRAIGVVASGDPEQALAGADVVIDFSLPDSTDAILAACVARRLPVVIGTTGLTERQQAALNYAASQIPVFYAANMSIGLNLLRSLAKSAAMSLGPEFDAEILDVHHRFKRDAPSGSALELGAAVVEGRGSKGPAEIGRRPGDGARESGAVGYASLRAGDVVGEHSVLLAGPGERLELIHRVSDRAAFALGAIRAARWLAGRGPGRYGMDDMLADG